MKAGFKRQARSPDLAAVRHFFIRAEGFNTSRLAARRLIVFICVLF
jgi:hypothetical protein